RRRAGIGVGPAAVEAHLGAVVEAVVVAVDVEQVDEAVAVGIVRGVRLLTVGDPVVVAVGIVGIAPEEALEVVAEAVAVAVGVGRIGVVGAIAGGRIGLAHVDDAVEVRVLAAVADAAIVGVRLQR